MTSMLVAADAADTNIICKPHVVCRDSINSMWLAHLVCINSNKHKSCNTWPPQTRSAEQLKHEQYWSAAPG